MSDGLSFGPAIVGATLGVLAAAMAPAFAAVPVPGAAGASGAAPAAPSVQTQGAPRRPSSAAAAARGASRAASAEPASGAASTTSALPLSAETASHGRFKDVAIYKPAGIAREVVLFLSSEAGWNAPLAALARSLADAGALVAGIDLPRFLAALPPNACFFPDGDLENLSHYLQAAYRLPGYTTPMLIGSGDGGALAYAMLAQAPATVFAGGVSLDFCPSLPGPRPLCRGEGVHFTRAPTASAAGASAASGDMTLLPAERLAKPWIATPPESTAACEASAARRFVASVGGAQWVTVGNGDLATELKSAYRKLAAHRAETLPPPPTSLVDLPIVELPAAGDGERFAVLLSGDGGWAGIDKALAASLVAKGVSVAGFDSLRYFWQERTPEGLASDVDRIVRYYAAHWNRREAILIGYSQGADVLPFVVNRLPAHTRSLVKLHALLGPGQNASFEFHVTNWLGPAGDKPIAPEALQLSSADTLCIYGTTDAGSLCPSLTPDHAQAAPLTGGHHFSGDYDGLAEMILQRMPR